MKHIVLILASLFVINAVVAQGIPKRELRGAWITTYLNLDWPTNASQTPDQERAAFINLLETLRQTGINAVFVQIRSECDAMYPGAEPWSAYLTGVQGTAPVPFYDPLQFMIDACRARGMEFHAWINPFRAINNFNNINNFATNHVARTRPEWLLAQGTYRILDPGLPAVRDYVIGVVMDVVRRYDVDGIHFDDYFYPYPSQGGSPAPPRFNDDATYNADPRSFPNTTAGRNDWRRDNINRFVQRTYDSVTTAKPWVKFGISPFGIWRNQSADPVNGSATNGLQSFSDIFADTRAWLQNGWLDYAMPQLYWSIGFAVANYGVLAPWWNNNAFGRHIYIGHAAYKVNADADANWTQPSQINNQVRLNRQQSNLLGSVFFRTGNLVANPLSVRDSLSQHVFRFPSLPPVMPWKDAAAPLSPTNLTATVTGTSVQLNWQRPPATAVETDKVRQFVLYRSGTTPVNINDATLIRHITPNDAPVSFIDNNLQPGNYHYAVTAIDRMYNESATSNTVTATVLATSVTDREIAALQLHLYPNPAATSTQLSFTLQRSAAMHITLADLNGRQLMVLANGTLQAGGHNIQVPVDQLKNGIYLIRFSTSTFTHTVRLVVLN